MNVLLYFRGTALVAIVTVTLGAQAQDAGTKAPSLPPVPPLPVLGFKTVAPGVTLHQSSPVLYFRAILGMTPAERDHALTNKSADARKFLLQKVDEYQKLPADIREARLRQTQLRWELNSLAKLSPAETASFIKEAPLEDRPLLEDYSHWQALDFDARRDFLAKLSPDRHQALTRSLTEWEIIPESARQQASGQFSQIVYLNPAQQKQTLNGFSEAERKTMEAALARFASLPEAQRSSCVASFQEFATMNSFECEDFLKNAARWEAMTASERDLWRTLVQKFKIMPPSPPGLFNADRYPPLPPMPLLLPPRPAGMTAAQAAVTPPKN